MGLVIGVTACCCAYCAYKKKKKKKKMKRLRSNGTVEDGDDEDDPEAAIPAGQSMMRGETGDASSDEINTDDPLERQPQIGPDNDPPPPYRAATTPTGLLENVDEVADSNAGTKKHSKKHKHDKYESLAPSSQEENVSGGDEVGSNNPQQQHECQHHHVGMESDSNKPPPMSSDEMMEEIIDAIVEVNEEDDTGAGAGTRNSSKKYKYSSLTAAHVKETKRVKSVDSQRDYEEIKMDVSDDIQVTTSAAYV